MALSLQYDLFPRFDEKDSSGVAYQWCFGKVAKVTDGDTIVIYPEYKSPNFHTHTDSDPFKHDTALVNYIEYEELEIRFAGINTFETSEHRSQYDSAYAESYDNRQKKELARHKLEASEHNIDMAYKVGDEAKTELSRLLDSYGNNVFVILDTFNHYTATATNNGVTNTYNTKPGHDAYGKRHVGKVYLLNNNAFSSEEEVSQIIGSDAARSFKNDINIFYMAQDTSLIHTYAMQAAFYAPVVVTEDLSQSIDKLKFSFATYTNQELDIVATSNFIQTNRIQVLNSQPEIEDLIDYNNKNIACARISLGGFSALYRKMHYTLRDKLINDASIQGAFNDAVFTAFITKINEGIVFNPTKNVLNIVSASVTGNETNFADVLNKITFTIGTLPVTFVPTDNYELWKIAVDLSKYGQFYNVGSYDVPLQYRLDMLCVNTTLLSSYSSVDKRFQLAHSSYVLVNNTKAKQQVSSTLWAQAASAFPVVAWAKYETDVTYKTKETDTDDLYTVTFDKMYEAFTATGGTSIYMDKWGNLYRDDGPDGDKDSLLKKKLVRLDNDLNPTGEYYSPPTQLSSNLNPVPSIGSEYGEDIISMSPEATMPKLPSNDYSMIIGDVELIIPPQSISINEVTKGKSIQTLRTKSSMQIGSNHSDIRINLELFFNDINAINGFEQDNPFTKIPTRTSSENYKEKTRLEIIKKQWPDPYAINGLRTLIAQFKKTPFVPIQNELVNTYGVFNVALENLSLSTVPNFPNCIAASLTLIPFNATVYDPTCFDLATKINWPMYRWFIQSAMQHTNNKAKTYLKPINGGMNHKIKFKIADESQLQEMTTALNKLKSMYTAAVFQDSNLEGNAIDRDLRKLTNCSIQKERYNKFMNAIKESDIDAYNILLYCRGNLNIYADVLDNDESQAKSFLDQDLNWLITKHNEIVNNPDALYDMRYWVKTESTQWEATIANAWLNTVMWAFNLWKANFNSLVYDRNDVGMYDLGEADQIRFKKLIFVDICATLINKLNVATYQGEEKSYIINYYAPESTYNEESAFVNFMKSGMILGALGPIGAGVLTEIIGVRGLINAMLIGDNDSAKAMLVSLKNEMGTVDGTYAVTLNSELLKQELPDMTDAGDIVVSRQSHLASAINTIKSFFSDGVTNAGTVRYIIPDDTIVSQLIKALSASAGAQNQYEQTYYDTLAAATITEEDLNMVDFNDDGAFDDLIVTGVTASLSNVYSEIQLEAADSPTLQYFGSQDNVYTVAAQTLNRDVVERLKTLFSEVQRIGREYRVSIVSGFLEIENDIINLCGTTAILPQSIDISTVPGYPELLNIKMSFIAFDRTQKRRETLNQMQLHFDGEFDFREDWLSYVAKRSSNDESQMMAFEQKLLTQEVYPDMELPTWYEFAAVIPYLNCGINNISDFNKLFGTLQPNRGKYVDPDFYVNCEYTTRMELYNSIIQATDEERAKMAMKMQSSLGEKMIVAPPDMDSVSNTVNAMYELIEANANAGLELIAQNSSALDDNKTTGNSQDNQSSSGFTDTISYGLGAKEITYSTDPTITGAIPTASKLVKHYALPFTERSQCGIENMYQIPSWNQVVEWFYSGYPAEALETYRKAYDNKDWKTVFHNPTIDEIYPLVYTYVKGMFEYASGTTAPIDDMTITTVYHNTASSKKTYLLATPKAISYEKLTRWIISVIMHESSRGVKALDSKFNQYEYNTTIKAHSKTIATVGVCPHYARTKISDGSNAVGLGQLTAYAGNIQSKEEFYRIAWDWKYNIYKSVECFANKYMSAWHTCMDGEGANAVAYNKKDEPGTRTSFLLELASQFYSSGISFKNFLNAGRWKEIVTHYQVICQLASKLSGVTTVTPASTGTGTQEAVEYGLDSDGTAHTLVQSGKASYLIVTTSKLLTSQSDDEFLVSTMPVPMQYTDSEATSTYFEAHRVINLNADPGNSATGAMTPIDTGISEGYDIFDFYMKQEEEKEYKAFIKSHNNSVVLNLFNESCAYMKQQVPGSSKVYQASSAFYAVIVGLPEILQRITQAQTNPNADAINSYLQEITRICTRAVATVYTKYKATPVYNSSLVLQLNLTIEPAGRSMGEIINHTTISLVPMTKEEVRSLLGDAISAAERGAQITEDDEVKFGKHANLVDFVSFSHHGRLLRAFPTFQMFIIDEGEWKLFYKMWDNLYGFNAIQSIELIKDKRIAADTAVIEMTNVYSNLTSKNNLGKASDWEFSIVNAIFKGDWTRLWTTVFDTVDEAIFESRKEVLDSMMLRPGARLHLRMGYGSNAETLPCVFNGTITEVSPPGEMITVIAQSDGLELTNRIPAKKDVTNDSGLASWVKLTKDPVHTILDIISSNGSYFQDSINKLFEKFSVRGNWIGIEHFGVPNELPTDLIKEDIFRCSMEKKAYGEIGINVHDVSGKNIVSRWTLSTVPTSYFDDLGDHTVGDNYRVIAYVNNNVQSYDSLERPKVYLYDKSVWDLCNILATCLPDFVVGAEPFGLRSTLFFGKPYYSMVYDYDYMYKCDITGSTKKITAVPVHAYRKAYEQTHLFESFSDIVQNNIAATSANMFTNVIVNYGGQAGDKALESPLISMDTDIRSEYQKTVQHYLDLAPSQITEGWGDFFCSKNIATVAGANILKEYAGNMYDGELLVLGYPALKPQDTFGLKDSLNDMQGLCGVRRVVQHMSLETGFTTSITPHCLAINDDTWLMKLRTNALTNIAHVAASAMMRTIPNLMFNRWGGTLLNRALLTGKGSAIKQAEKHVLTRMVDNIFGYNGVSVELRKAIAKSFKAPNITLPGALETRAFSSNAPLLDLIKSVKSIDTSKIDGFNKLDTKKMKVFNEMIKVMSENADTSKNSGALYALFRSIKEKDIIGALKDEEKVKGFIGQLDNISDALKIINTNKQAFIDASFEVGSDIDNIIDEINDLKKAVSAADTIKDASLIAKIEATANKIPTALKVANGLDDAADIAKAMRGIKTTSKIISFAKAANKFKSLIKVASCVGGIAGIAIETILEVSVEVGVRCLVEAYKRYRKTRQAILIFPIKYQGRNMTAGLSGHHGAVWGDSMSNVDKIFYDKDGYTLKGVNLNTTWLNEILFGDDVYNPFESVDYDPYEWITTETEWLTDADNENTDEDPE